MKHMTVFKNWETRSEYRFLKIGKTSLTRARHGNGTAHGTFIIQWFVLLVHSSRLVVTRRNATDVCLLQGILSTLIRWFDYPSGRIKCFRLVFGSVTDGASIINQSSFSTLLSQLFQFCRWFTGPNSKLSRLIWQNRNRISSFSPTSRTRANWGQDEKNCKIFFRTIADLVTGAEDRSSDSITVKHAGDGNSGTILVVWTLMMKISLRNRCVLVMSRPRHKSEPYHLMIIWW
jgi:hypothetical protein